MNCGSCYEKYTENRALLPMCKRPSGCKVGIEFKDPKNKHYDPDPLLEIGRAIAADPEVNNFIHEFVKAKVLYEHNGIASIQEQKFKELGLIDDTDFLLQLEQIYREGRNRQDNTPSLSQQNSTRKGSRTNRRV